jgi:hypothetical protein
VRIKARMGISADGFVATSDGERRAGRAPGAATHPRVRRGCPPGGLGGPRTIRAFHELGALDRLELVILPVLLGGGIPLSPPGAPRMALQLLRADRTFPDGSAELVYAATRNL